MSALAPSELSKHVQILLAYGRLAVELNLSRAPAPESQVSLAAVRQAELSYLRHWQSNPEIGRRAIAVVMAGEWVQNLARLEVDLERAVGTTARAAQRPWCPRWFDRSITGGVFTLAYRNDSASHVESRPGECSTASAWSSKTGTGALQAAGPSDAYTTTFEGAEGAPTATSRIRAGVAQLAEQLFRKQVVCV